MLQTGDGGEEIQVFPIDVNESLEIICILLGVQSLNLKKAQNNAFDLSVFFVMTHCGRNTYSWNAGFQFILKVRLVVELLLESLVCLTNILHVYTGLQLYV